MPTPLRTKTKEVEEKTPPALAVGAAPAASGKEQKAGKKGSRPAPDHPWRKFSFGKGRFRDCAKWGSRKKLTDTRGFEMREHPVRDGER